MIAPLLALAVIAGFICMAIMNVSGRWSDWEERNEPDLPEYDDEGDLQDDEQSL